MQQNQQAIYQVPELDPLRQTMTPEQLKTLNILKAAGPVGKTGPELHDQVWNYKGRIHELKNQFSAKIESVGVPGKRFKRYIFRGMKTSQEIREENRMVWVQAGRFEVRVPINEIKEVM